MKLSKNNHNDDVFGESELWKTEDGVKILKLKNQPEPDVKTGYLKLSTVGVLKTPKFYFLFPWEKCFDENLKTLDFSKLTGLIELAHGTNERKYFNLNPFTPPGKHQWNLHHLSPFPSTVTFFNDDFYNFRYLDRRIFGSSIIDTTTKQHTGKHILWDDKIFGEVTETHKEFVHQNDKFTASRKKYVSGTNKADNNNKIMDLELQKFETGAKFKSDHLPYMITSTSVTSSIGFVITRNRQHKTAYLSNLLSEIDDFGFPTNLVIISCRYRPPQKDWNINNNLGPKIFYVLGESNNTQKRWIAGSAYGVPVEFN